jgi:hypothetical protein
MSQQTQAENMVIAFDTFRQVSYVARAYWFQAQDVPEANLFYGLADAAGHEKQAMSVYQDVAAYDSPAPDDPRPPAPSADRPIRPTPAPTDRSSRPVGGQTGPPDPASPAVTASHAEPTAATARPSTDVLLP